MKGSVNMIGNSNVIKKGE